MKPLIGFSEIHFEKESYQSIKFIADSDFISFG